MSGRPGPRRIAFEALDILDLRCPPVNTWSSTRSCSDSPRSNTDSLTRRTLNSEGLVLENDWYHAFHQTLQIVEETPDRPEGLILNIRSRGRVWAILQAAGFTSMAFYLRTASA